jgi:hypothetical protein
MNFEKYSKQQFESLGRNSTAARQLADQLQADVNEELHAVVLPAFLKIVDRLNATGHNLTEYEPIVAGEIAFRDEPKRRCYLRLGCDVVISAGYADTMTAAEAYAEYEDGSPKPGAR